MNDQSADGDRPIVLDGVFFQFRDPSGIFRVWSELLAVWSESPFARNLVVLDRDGAVPKFPGIRYIDYPAYDSANAASESFLLEDICRKLSARFFLSTFHTQPVETPSVVMVHDVIPELFRIKQGQKWLQEKRYLTYNGRAFIAVSENTARDLRRVYPITKERPLCVALNGVSSSFHPVLPNMVQEFKAKHVISRPYFLVCGRRDQYKNAELFFKAFANLPQKKEFAIVCCGPRVLEPNFCELVDGTEVHMLTPDDENLNLAYNGAIALVYPSKYEGFGLPILEAMAAGCPVITCNNSSIAEIAGEAGFYVDEDHVPEMEQALASIQKPAVRDRLIRAGLERAREFSWNKTASTIAAFLSDLSSGDLHGNGYSLKDVTLPAFERWLEFRSCARECENISPKLQAVLSSPHLRKHSSATLDPQEKLKDLEKAWLKEMDIYVETL